MSHSLKKLPAVADDPWMALKSFTPARIALGRTGSAVPLKASLQFKWAHAGARDAVYSRLDMEALIPALEGWGMPVYAVQSRAENRADYLQNPHLGRRLCDDSAGALKAAVLPPSDLALILADGLSATAVNRHAVPVLRLLIPLARSEGLSIAPVSLVEQGRVAIGDEIAHLLHAKLSLILIGERPGLTAPYSLGAYLTYNPVPGLTDESRNCISNIHPAGLSYDDAVQIMAYLIKASLRLRLSGVRLKGDPQRLEVME